MGDVNYGDMLKIAVYVRDNDCGDFDSLVGCLLSDVRTGRHLDIYESCFAYPDFARSFCRNHANGTIDITIGTLNSKIWRESRGIKGCFRRSKIGSG
ncbi:MAG: hypothetical protein HDQ88_04425 [Clostridia bacterium]|nr:hypothetical protein [Clostridia bacterium]